MLHACHPFEGRARAPPVWKMYKILIYSQLLKLCHTMDTLQLLLFLRSTHNYIPLVLHPFRQPERVLPTHPRTSDTQVMTDPSTVSPIDERKRPSCNKKTVSTSTLQIVCWISFNWEGLESRNGRKFHFSLHLLLLKLASTYYYPAEYKFQWAPCFSVAMLLLKESFYISLKDGNILSSSQWKSPYEPQYRLLLLPSS